MSEQGRVIFTKVSYDELPQRMKDQLPVSPKSKMAIKFDRYMEAVAKSYPDNGLVVAVAREVRDLYELNQAAPEPLSPSPEIRGAINGEDFDSFAARIFDMCTRGKERWLREDLKAFLNNNESSTPTQAPEIRYQLRNWHHVTCAGFGGQACTCLAQREALIAELAVCWSDEVEKEKS